MTIDESFERVKALVLAIRRVRASGSKIDRAVLQASDEQAYLIYSAWSEQIKVLAKLTHLEIIL